MMSLQDGANIAATIILLEWFLLWLVPLALVVLAVRGMQRLLPRVRPWLRAVYEWLYMAGAVIDTVMRWLLAPILYLSGLKAGVQAGAAALRRR
jgi:hypothetical protein